MDSRGRIGGATAVWFACNPVPEREGELNQLITFKAEGVQDGEVLRRHKLFIDIDVIHRPSSRVKLRPMPSTPEQSHVAVR